MSSFKMIIFVWFINSQLCLQIFLTHSIFIYLYVWSMILVSRPVYLKVYLSTIGSLKGTVKMDVLNTGLFFAIFAERVKRIR